MDRDLHTELMTIQSKLDTLIAVKDDVVKHDAILHGDGDDNPGLIRQVDRLNQNKKWHDRVSTALLTAIVGLGADRLWHSIMHWHS